jgi:hypothetical protein
VRNKRTAILLAMIPFFPFHLSYLHRDKAMMKLWALSLFTGGMGGLALNLIETVHLLLMSDKDFQYLYNSGKKDDGKFVCEAKNKVPPAERMKEEVEEGMAAAGLGNWSRAAELLDQAFLVDALVTENPKVRGAYVDALIHVGKEYEARNLLLEWMTEKPEKLFLVGTEEGILAAEETRKLVLENREELARRVPVIPIDAKDYEADKELARKRSKRLAFVIIALAALIYLPIALCLIAVDVAKEAEKNDRYKAIEAATIAAEENSVEAKLEREEKWRKQDERLEEEHRQILIQTGWLPGAPKPPALLNWERKRNGIYDRHAAEVERYSKQENNHGGD